MRVELETSVHVLNDVHQFLCESGQGLERQDALPDHVRDLRDAARAIRSAQARERGR